ncbi:MAG: T9SS type A sorting domain-containing protein [Bacteroidetes bacterium]|nr:T9SS type A sorting domain-containing protein [Bacteroidota bacterium]
MRFAKLSFIVIATIITNCLFAQTQSWSKVAFSNRTVKKLVYNKKTASVYAVVSSSADDTLYKSTDGGINWKAIKGFYFTVKNIGLTYNDFLLWVSFSDSLLMSTDGGTVWRKYFKNNSNEKSLQFSSSGKLFLFSEGSKDSIFVSSDTGKSFTGSLMTGLPPTLYPNRIYGYGTDTIFATGSPYSGLLFKSFNGGNNWAESTTGINKGWYVKDITFSSQGDTIYLIDQFYFYISTNRGLSWSKITDSLTSTSEDISVTAKGDVLLAGYAFSGSDNGGIFLLKRNTSYWLRLKTGLPLYESGTCVTFLDDNSALLGTSSDGLYKTNQITSVNNKIVNMLPSEFIVDQNYPNPFNPSTTIKIHLPINTKISIDICDNLGRSIRNLLSEEMSIGSHNVIWNGKDSFGNTVASGIYFYRVKYLNTIVSKSMLFLK